MMKKILRRFKLVFIDVLVYHMQDYKSISIENEYKIEKSTDGHKICYFIKDNNKIVHKSFLIPKVYLMKSLNKKGPVIGDCVTVNSHRGQSIYPYVINKIAQDVINNDKTEVYVIVNSNNLSSIRGIEKAGFSKLASIVATRWLWFYFKRKITYLNK